MSENSELIARGTSFHWRCLRGFVCLLMSARGAYRCLLTFSTRSHRQIKRVAFLYPKEHQQQQRNLNAHFIKTGVQEKENEEKERKTNDRLAILIQIAENNASDGACLASHAVALQMFTQWNLSKGSPGCHAAAAAVDARH